MLTSLPSSTSRPRREFPRALALVGVVITLIALGGIASNEFVEWDDWLMISRNTAFNPPTFASVLPYALPRNALLYLYIPLTQYFWGVLSIFAYVRDADVDGSHLNPWVFHSASIGVHMVSGLVVFLLLRRLLKIVNGDRSALWPAWVGAMTFAIHPVQVEAVAWASGMKDVLSGLFVMLCAFCFVRFRTSEPIPDRRSIWRSRSLWYALGVICLLAANFSKASAVATPLVVMVIDVIVLRTSVRRSAAALLPWFLLMIPFVIVTRQVQPYSWIDLKPTPIYFRPFVAGDALAFYAWKLIAPIRLSFDYNRRPGPTLVSGFPFIDWLVPVALILISLRPKEHRLLLGGLLLIIAALMPVLGFVPFGSQEFSTVSDHYLYPAMLGTAMCVAWLVNRFDRRWVSAMVWIALASWTVLSARAGQVWETNEQLCRHALQISPESWNALNGLGVSLQKNGDLVDAERCYKRSIELNDRNGMVHLNLALLLIHENRAEEALFQLRRMTHYYQLQPNADMSVAEMAQIAIAAMMLKNHHPELAIEACRAALALDPKDQRAMMMLARAQQATTRPGDVFTITSSPGAADPVTSSPAQ